METKYVIGRIWNGLGDIHYRYLRRAAFPKVQVSIGRFNYQIGPYEMRSAVTIVNFIG